MRFVFYALKGPCTFEQHPTFALENKIHLLIPKLFRRFCAINLLDTWGVLEFSIHLVHVGNQRLPEENIRESRRRNAPRRLHAMFSARPRAPHVVQALNVGHSPNKFTRSGMTQFCSGLKARVISTTTFVNHIRTYIFHLSRSI